MVSDSLDRPALVAHARDSIARGSKSFAMASKLFDPVTRERAWLLYAWCRKCDDIADGQDHGGTMSGVTDGQARLSTLRVLTDAALRGEPTGDPAFDGFGVVMRECAIPHRYAHDLLEGFASMRATGGRAARPTCCAIAIMSRAPWAA